MQDEAPAQEDSGAAGDYREHECLLLLVLSLFGDWCSRTLPSALRKVRACSLENTITAPQAALLRLVRTLSWLRTPAVKAGLHCMP